MQLMRTFRQYPNNAVFQDATRIVSYREFNDSVNAMSRIFHERGFKEDRMIAVLGGNCIEYLVTLHALWKIKCIPVLLNVRWPPDSIIRTLQSLGIKKMLTGSSYFQDIPHTCSVYSFSDVINSSSMMTGRDEFYGELLDPEQEATIIFTSGSSGEPKAVLHTFGNHLYSALGSNQNIEVIPGDCWLVSLPLYHVGGLSITLRTMLVGATAWFQTAGTDLISAIPNENITHLSLVATQLYRLLQNQQIIPRLRRLKAILLGGGPIPENLIKQAVNYQLPVYTSYGSTEMSSQVTTTRPGDSLEHLLTSGCLLPFRQLHFSAESEILVKGETLFKGYVGPNGLKKNCDSDGWFHTGDTGKIDDSGYLTLSGRTDNMFISGGENIQPEEIERFVRHISQVEEVIVVPVEDFEYGFRPVAFVKLKNRESWQPTIKEIKNYLKSNLPGYKLPDRYLNWPKDQSIPAGLKLNRGYFRQLAEKQISTKDL